MSRASLAILGLLFAFTVAADPVNFQSSSRRTSLLELYTSEGCSSCPPAEICLSRLKTAPGLWADFVPVAFHVDYWDYLGWTDKWAQREFSNRQRSYARAWSAGGVYTPGFVLNGNEWRNWSARAALPPAATDKPGVLRATSEDAIHWQVSFVPAMAGDSSYEVHAAVLACELNSDVKAGENAGRHLEHDFAALKLISTALTQQGETFNGTFDLDAHLKSGDGKPALAIWLTRTGSIEPLQAAGGWISNTAK
jgi:hypothetical protein